ncbi:Diphthamide synthesis DPH1/DPH2 [Gorgonomyces haynaldii]|nr:Diphthamide synthesis DPH1/DPH2 [Gorgonomyces haynaldii]
MLEDEQLQSLMERLPKNYNFEIYKTLHQIKRNQYKRIALQFPEGLLMYSTTIADIIEFYCQVETVIMGDVTYGACCIDDFTSTKLGCDFLVHYGHSCLVPITSTLSKTMYVFVDIQMDLQHFVDTVKKNIEPGKRLVLVGTIQFVASLQKSVSLFSEYEILIPQSRPLSKGEILGCTAPRFENHDFIIYVGDGRFHLEAIMIANPDVPALRYDPYSKKFTSEKYQHQEMQELRKEAIEHGQRAKSFGLIVGTLGRQGSPKVMEYLIEQLQNRNIRYTILLLSELFPQKLAMFDSIDCWIQISCPRLSIDWGYAFPKPLLTPYEAAVVFGKQERWDVAGTPYPMDFYAQKSLGPWTPNHRPT